MNSRKLRNKNIKRTMGQTFNLTLCFLFVFSTICFDTALAAPPVAVDDIYIVDEDTTLMVGTATNWYVAPEGSPDGDGSISNPWDLQTAFNHPASVQPGDTIWLRGLKPGERWLSEGTVHKHPNRADQSSGYSFRLSGAPGKPITIRPYPGERATIDGGIVTSSAARHVRIRDIEFIISENLTGGRITNSTDSFDEPTDPERPLGGINLPYGHDIKFINNTIHLATNTSFGFWGSVSGGSELYGNIVYDSGYIGLHRGHGPAVYGQNRSGDWKYIRNNIMFDHYNSHLIQLTGSSRASIDMYHIEDNFLFNTLKFEHRPGIIIGSYGSRLSYHGNVLNNMFYRASLNVGYNGGLDDVAVIGNRFFNSSLRTTNTRNLTRYDNLIWQTNRTIPDTPQIFLNPNEYDPNRAHLAIMAFGNETEVEVDLGSFLKDGEVFKLMAPDNFYGAPAYVGIYRGSAVFVPLTSEFTVYVVLKHDGSPIAFDDGPYVIAPGTEKTINVLSNDRSFLDAKNLQNLKIVNPPKGGAAVAQDGNITYTHTHDDPQSSFFGADIFSYIVYDDNGQVSNEATVIVNVSGQDTQVDFNNYTIKKYGGYDVDTGTLEIRDNGQTLYMKGDMWKLIDVPYYVTPNTVIEFDFESSVQGDIHAIGFDRDYGRSPGKIFKLYGTDSFGIADYDNYPAQTHYVIPVGEYFQGLMKYLVFAADDDTGDVTGESIFSNIRIYESTLADPLSIGGKWDIPDGVTPMLFSASLLISAGLQGVLTNDTYAAGYTLELTGGPSDGDLTLNADGTFNYIPNDNFYGQDNFTYIITDTEGPSNTATVTINVNPVNEMPQANDDTYTVDGVDMTLTVTAPGLLANDTDVDQDELSAIVVTEPLQGTLVLNADGSFTYILNAGFTSTTDTFTYRVTDGIIPSTMATVTLTVGDVPASLFFSVDTYRALENTGTVTINVKRLGSMGSVTVDYATQDGSAIAGIDYESAFGTLSWPDQDRSERIITVAIIDNSLQQVNKTLQLSLSNPTGGASLGNPSLATLTILDDEGVDITAGLIGHWKFDEGSGTDASDSSGNDNQAVLIDGPSWVTGRIGGALNFDGVDDYVEAEDSASLNVDYLTMTAWVYRETSETASRIIVNKENSYEMQIGASSGAGQDHFEFAIQPNWAWYDGGFVPLGEWAHVAVTWNGNEARTYISGQLTNTHDLSDGVVTDTTNALRIGARGAPNSAGSPFKGKIDDVRIYNRALSPSEIATLASATQNTYTIQATAGLNGSISPSGAVTVNENASQAFTIAANAGYVISDVLVDGNSVDAVTSYTFTNVTAGHTIEAAFTVEAGDTLPPAITITSPLSGDTIYQPSLTVQGAVTDNVGLNQIELRLNGTLIRTIDLSIDNPLEAILNIDFTPAEIERYLTNDSNNTLTIDATDSSGNSSQTTTIDNIELFWIDIGVTYAPVTGIVPVTVSFTATPHGRTIALYEWDFDGKGVYDRRSANNQAAYTYYGLSAYPVRLRITEAGTAIVHKIDIELNLLARVGLSPQVNSITLSPEFGLAPLRVVFKASVSDPNNQIIKYEWDFNRDGVYDLCSYDSPRIVRFYDTSGIYFPVLKVTNSGGYTATSDSLSLQQVLVSQPQTAPIINSFSTPQGGPVPHAVSFTVNASNFGNKTIERYEWDFDGDGRIDRISRVANISYIYQNPGHYTASVKVRDSENICAIAWSQDIYVRPGSVDIFYNRLSGNAPFRFRFSDVFSGNINDLSLCLVDFDGDGKFDRKFDLTDPDVSIDNIRRIYREAGKYRIKIKARVGAQAQLYIIYVNVTNQNRIFIKMPEHNQTVGGSAVSVVARLSSALKANMDYIQFRYRVNTGSTIGPWQDISPQVTQWPYSVQWDTRELNGGYDLGAGARIDSSFVPSKIIHVTVDNNQKANDEIIDTDTGSYTKTLTPNDANEIIVSDGAQVNLPSSEMITSDNTLTLRLTSSVGANEESLRDSNDTSVVPLNRYLYVDFSQELPDDFSVYAELTISYTGQDLANAGIDNEENLTLYGYEPGIGWKRLAYSVCYPDSNYVSGYSSHFSLFGLGGGSGGGGSSGDGDFSGGGGGCFIATAAYGTPLAEEIKVLSKFRDEYLLTNTFGKKLVKFYYHNSPPIADYIRTKPKLKAVVRTLFKPVVWVTRRIIRSKEREH